jgi:hypothetical protein
MTRQSARGGFTAASPVLLLLLLPAETQTLPFRVTRRRRLVRMAKSRSHLLFCRIFRSPTPPVSVPGLVRGAQASRRCPRTAAVLSAVTAAVRRSLSSNTRL